MKNNRIAIAFAAAILISLIVAIQKLPAAAGGSQGRSGNGAGALWEKTAGPLGLRTNAIFEASNIVYAGTETQGVTNRPTTD